MTTQHELQISNLLIDANEFSNVHGAEISKLFEQQSLLLLNWVEFLSKFHKTGIADNLLGAVSCSLLETDACLSLGLARPAIFSLRTQIDLILAWLYFKDHAVEWELVNNIGEGFKLKKELHEYYAKHFAGFSKRYGLLTTIKTFKHGDIYRLLSAHIHGQSVPVLPNSKNLRDVVSNKKTCLECTELAHGVSEYINDVLVSIYVDNWNALPKQIKDFTTLRFVNSNQKAEFFS